MKDLKNISDVESINRIYLSAVGRYLYDSVNDYIDAKFTDSTDIEIKEQQFTATKEYTDSIFARLASERLIIPLEGKVDPSKEKIQSYSDCLWRFNLNENIYSIKAVPEFNHGILDATVRIWKELVFDDIIRQLKELFSYYLKKEIDIDSSISNIYWDLLDEFPTGTVQWMNWVSIRNNEGIYSKNYSKSMIKARVFETLQDLKRKVRGDMNAKFYERHYTRPAPLFYKYWLGEVFNIEEEAYKHVPSKRLLSQWFDFY